MHNSPTTSDQHSLVYATCQALHITTSARDDIVVIQGGNTITRPSAPAGDVMHAIKLAERGEL